MTVSGFSACIQQTERGPGRIGYVTANCSIDGVQCDTRTQKHQTIRTQEKRDTSQTQNVSVVYRVSSTQILNVHGPRS